MNTAVTAGAVAYLAVMVGCWVKVAADYRYEVLRNIRPGTTHFGTFSTNRRKDHAYIRVAASVAWPLWLIGSSVYTAGLAFVAAAGRLGERRVAREDAEVEALKEDALAMKRTRDMFDEGTDEWALLNTAAVAARATWQKAMR